MNAQQAGQRFGDILKRLGFHHRDARAGFFDIDAPLDEQRRRALQHRFHPRKRLRESQNFQHTSHILESEDGPTVALA